MSWMSERRERKQQERRRAEQARIAAQKQRQRERITDQLAICADIEGAYDERADCPIITKRGEEVIAVMNESGLVEVKAGKTQYQGGSQGVSIRVAKGVSYRVGAHKGTVTRGPEMPRILCLGGTVVVTNKRAVYVGSKYTREFDFTKMVSMTESVGEGGNCLLLAVTNRQKVSGVLVGNHADLVISRCEIGLAIANDTLPELVADLESELSEL